MDTSAKKIRDITVIGLVLNILLTASKAVGGFLFNSQALIADAVHSCSDLVTDFAVLVGVKYWNIPADESHPYGHGRIETVISAFIGVLLAGVAVGLSSEAVMTIRNGEYTVPGMAALWIAVFSIFSKEVLFRATVAVARRCSSSALEANAAHHRSDALSSIPVAAAVVISNIFPQLKYVDQIGAFVVSAFIIMSAWQIIKPAIDELCDAGDCNAQHKIREIAEKYPQISSVHLIRTRRIGKTVTGDLHIMVVPDITVREGHRIAHQLKAEILAENSQISDITIHVEPAEKD